MSQVHRFSALGFAIITSIVSLTLAAQTGDTAAIQQKLNSQFKLTRITADRSDIVTAGDVAVIHKPGLIMYAVASPMAPSNTYKNGKIGQGWSGFGKDMLITMVVPGGGTANDYPHRPFAPDEKCWVTGIQAQKDGILFQLYSDPYDNIRYYANLKIPYPNKKEIPSADAAMQLVAEVLSVAPPDNQDAQPAQDGPQAAFAGQYVLGQSGVSLHLLSDSSCTMRSPGNAESPCHFVIDGDWLVVKIKIGSVDVPIWTLRIQGDKLFLNTTEFVRQGEAPAPAPEAASAPAPPPPAQMTAIAPPPPPADVPPPTIEVGETMDQVTAGFGQPLKVAKLGVKVIFYYKDMKVTFTNGKVSNIE